MNTIKTQSQNHQYSATFAEHLSFLDPILQQTNTFWIIDAKVFHLYHTMFSTITNDKIFLLEASEENKSMNTVLQIVEKMGEASCNRQTTLIAVGGGLTLDVVGFAASIYMRGISWISIPTTLLAAADSCLGGKTAVNSSNVKNLLGTFHPPKSIFIDVEFLKTLSLDDFKSGVGEMLKIALLSGKENVDEFENDLPELLQQNGSIIKKYIYKSLLYKKEIVEQDELESGMRRVLNYGHTYGHAIEVVSNYKISHGKAVAMGMVMVNRVAVSRGFMQVSTAERVKNMVIQIYGEIASLIPPQESLHPILLRDKKNTSAEVNFVFINDEFLPIIP